VSIQLLPSDYDDRIRAAVQAFWRSRHASGEAKQGGTRDAVIGGKNMDGFCDLVRAVAVHCGLPPEAIYTRRGSGTLPGYYRATKTWDVLAIYRGRLIAAFEFKSQVGSFGNNFNNRTEEVLGSAADLWVAHRQGAFATPVSLQGGTADPRPPFLGWLMLLEDCPSSRSPVVVDEPHYKAFPEFYGASYARRYQLLAERLVKEQLYGAAALLLSTSDGGEESGAHRELSIASGHRTLFAEFAARSAAAVLEASAR
jgi:Restriction endonuclease XhoI